MYVILSMSSYISYFSRLIIYYSAILAKYKECLLQYQMGYFLYQMTKSLRPLTGVVCDVLPYQIFDTESKYTKWTDVSTNLATDFFAT